MAKAVCNSTPITWIPLLAARDLVAKIYRSASYAERWLFEQLAADRIRWKAEAVHPLGRSLDKFWHGDSGLFTVDWADGTVTNKAMGIVVTTGEAAFTMGFDSVTAYGISLALEDIEALLPAEKLSIALSESPPPAPPGSPPPRGRKLDKVKAVAVELFGGEGRPPESMTSASALKKLGDELQERGIESSPTTQLRAIGRRRAR